MTSPAPPVTGVPLFHRFPMLRIDRVLHVVPGKEATAQVAVASDDAMVRDAAHYPAVLLLEAMAQVAALFAEGPARAESGSLAGLSDVTFGAPVPVGSRLEVTTRLVGSFGRLWRTEGVVMADGREVARGHFTIAL